VPFGCAFVVSEDKKSFPIMREEFLSLFKDLKLHHRQPTLVIFPNRSVSLTSLTFLALICLSIELLARKFTETRVAIN
jgi:hypothetical protein